MRSKFTPVLLGVFVIIVAFTSSLAQNLTVRDIMAEPSIAGMRVEGEKLSPDGSKVVYLWNAEGKMPRDLYLVSTSGGAPKVILRVSDLPRPAASPSPSPSPSLSPSPSPAAKLDYGLVVKDQFAKDRENQLGNFEWSSDSTKLVFSYGGDIYVLKLGETAPKRYTKTQAPEVAARFLDNDRILYQQNGNLFVLNTADATTVQLSKEAKPTEFVVIGQAVANKAANMVAYIVSDNSKQKALIVPNYLDDFVQAGTVRRGWSEQKVLVVPADGSREAPFEIKLPKPEGVSNFRRLVWAADNRSLIVDRNDKDTKLRQLFYIHNVGSKDEQQILVTEETDDKWQAPLSALVEPNPKDPNQLFFASEKDGYNHLYLATLQAETRPVGSVPSNGERVQQGGETLSKNVTIKQMTRGNWQVEWAKWRSDQTIAYLSTQQGTTVREFYTLSADGTVTHYAIHKDNELGMKDSPQLAEGNDYLLYSFSKWNQPPDLYGYAREIDSRTAETIWWPAPLTQTADQFGQFVISRFSRPLFPTKAVRSTPSQNQPGGWVVPKFIDILSRDAKQIKSKIYLPAGFDKKKKYPMVVFVHGAGYLQNVTNGWNNYFREFMFNELLTQKGYVVLDIDYRGSAGYGREWRTDVYDFLGGKDYDDHLDAIDFMIKNYAVDAKHVGVYGGSYGGFMAEMLAFRAPEKIAAAAALRPVADWKNYYASSPAYTAQRLGFPDKNPEAYRRSSPISYADGLKTQLLILHGEADDNVQVQDSMQLVEKLIRLGKTPYFQVMFYPSENHGFVRPESWTDEYERILAFFEKNLK
jgi:dipeptidyl aminopeptidase/acylaminoacyl peptidase